MTSITKNRVTTVSHMGKVTGIVRPHCEGWILEIPETRRTFYFSNMEEAIYNAN